MTRADDERYRVTFPEPVLRLHTPGGFHVCTFLSAVRSKRHLASWVQNSDPFVSLWVKFGAACKEGRAHSAEEETEASCVSAA